VVCPALQYFYTVSHTRHDFRKTLLNVACVFRFSVQIVSGTFLILRRNERDIVKNVYWTSCKISVIIVRFQWNLNFLDRLSRNTEVSNFMKIPSMGAELFHAEGGTDMKQTVDIRNFSIASKTSRTKAAQENKTFVVSSMHFLCKS